MSPEELRNRTMHLMFEVSRILHQTMMHKMKDERLNLMQLHVLFFLEKNAGITMKELAQYLKITSPSTTAFVNRFVKLGWVKRAQDTKNRKLVRLSLTAAGRKVLRDKQKIRQEVMADIFSLLLPKDQKELNRVFEHLLTSYKRTHL